MTEGLNALEGIKQDIKSIIDTIDATVESEEPIFGKRKTKPKDSEKE